MKGIAKTPEHRFQEDTTCDECGGHGALAMGEGHYCPECCRRLGSSCAGSSDAEELRPCASDFSLADVK